MPHGSAESIAAHTVLWHSTPLAAVRWAPRGNEPHKGQHRSIRSAGATALGGDCDGAAAGAHGSLLAAVSAQRDRFRAKAQLLEEESEKVKRQSNALVRRLYSSVLVPLHGIIAQRRSHTAEYS